MWSRQLNSLQPAINSGTSQAKREARKKELKDSLGINPYTFFFFFAKSHRVFSLFPRTPIPLALNLTTGKML